MWVFVQVNKKVANGNFLRTTQVSLFKHKMFFFFSIKNVWNHLLWDVSSTNKIFIQTNIVSQTKIRLIVVKFETKLKVILSLRACTGCDKSICILYN